MITEPESLKLALDCIRKAQALYANYTQEQVDKIFFSAAKAAAMERIPISKKSAL